MRITVLSNQDLASNMALNLLIKQAPQHTYKVLLSESVGGKIWGPEALQKLRFIEQTLFNTIVFPLLDNNPDNDGQTKSFKQLANNDYSSSPPIDIKTISDINSVEGIQQLASHKPNLIVSIRFGQILQQAAIDIPEFGVINLHSGILPQYRGVMATFWAMLARQEQIGTSLHFIDSSRIDAGELISVNTRPVDYNQSYLNNVLALYPEGVDQLVAAINNIETGKALTSEPLNLADGAYYGFPSKADLANFNQQGLTLVNYEEVSELVARYM